MTAKKKKHARGTKGIAMRCPRCRAVHRHPGKRTAIGMHGRPYDERPCVRKGPCERRRTRRLTAAAAFAQQVDEGRRRKAARQT